MMEIGHVMKLRDGYALRAEQPEVKYYEFSSYNELEKVLRKEFGEGDGKSE